MPLPKVDKPLIDIEIPSLKKKVKFRPYMAKEEKILLMAQEGHDMESISDKDLVDAVKQIINNCCMDSTIDVDKLAIFDLDYVYIQLRAKSVNNRVEVAYKDLEDDQVYRFDINLDEIKILENPEHSNKVIVTDDITMTLKYPTLDVAERMAKAETETQIFEIMLENSVDKIYDKETVYTEYSEDELRSWLEDSLDSKAFAQVKDFFNTLPQIKHVLEYTNQKGTKRRIELTSLRDFFTF